MTFLLKLTTGERHKLLLFKSFGTPYRKETLVPERFRAVNDLSFRIYLIALSLMKRFQDKSKIESFPSPSSRRRWGSVNFLTPVSERLLFFRLSLVKLWTKQNKKKDAKRLPMEELTVNPPLYLNYIWEYLKETSWGGGGGLIYI